MTRRRITLPIVVGLIVSAFFVAQPASPVFAITIVVNTTTDDPGDTCSVDGPCSLRSAIDAANANAGPDVIVFEIPGGGPHTLAPTTPLPTITDTVTIDGFSQPGSAANTDAVASNAVYGVVLDGSAITPSATYPGEVGLDLRDSTGSVVRGLAIGNFGVGVVAGPSAVIEGNFIGTDAAGSTDRGGVIGVLLEGVDGVRVGGTVPGARNVISGHYVGVTFTRDSDDNTIVGNLVGTDATGQSAIPNDYGISLEPVFYEGVPDGDTRNDNWIGDGTPAGRNVISGNSRDGISIWANTTGTLVRGNVIGAAADGFTALGNDQNGADPDSGGIVVRNFSGGNQFGGRGGGDGNLVAFNNNGIVLYTGTGNSMIANQFVGNLDRAIFVNGAQINDPGDIDEGANRGQNHPLLRAGIDIDGNVRVETSVDSLETSATYPVTVDYFIGSTAVDGGGYGFIASETWTGPETRVVDLGPAADVGVTTGDPIVALATDATGNTSVFSPVALIDRPERLEPGREGDRSGETVDLDGNRMAVSRPGADVGAPDAGVVRIYERADDRSPWALAATLRAPEPEAGAGFGDSIALNGDRIAIGESDINGGGVEPGRVWVFERTGTDWGVIEELAAPGGESAPGDLFGTDVAWLDADRLFVGAPGALGTGAIYRADVTTGTTTNVTPAGIAPSAGDDFGFAIDLTPRPDAPGYWLAVGIPGRDADGGGYYFVTLDASGDSVTWRGGSGVAAGSRYGSAVAIDGNRAVVGSYGSGTMYFELYEYRDFGAGVEWGSNVSRTIGPAAGFESGIPANDYLDISADHVAIAQPGDGGRVALFRFDGGVLAASPTVIEPPDREAGDRIGRALALDGSTLVAGAPGDDGTFNEFFDAGALFTYRVPVTATFIDTDTSTTQPWEDPANWDVGVVPGPGDTVIVPIGTYPEVNEATTVELLTVQGNLRVGAQFGVTGELDVTGTVDVQSEDGDALGLAPSVLLDGEIVGGLVIANGPTSVTGTGLFHNDGELRKVGPGTLTLASGVDWISRFASVVDVQGGRIEIDGTLLESSGSFEVAAGTTLAFAGDLAVGPGSAFVTEISGPSSSAANYGQIQVGQDLRFDPAPPFPGTGTVGFTAIVDGHSVGPADVYPAIVCDRDCRAGIRFDEFDLAGLDAVLRETSLDLRIVENKIANPGWEPPAGPFDQFGRGVDVDGDWAVVGSRIPGPVSVYEFVSGDWTLRQTLTNGSAQRVAIDGDDILADGIRYTRTAPGAPFEDAGVTGGTSFGIDGGFAIVGETAGAFDALATVSVLETGDFEALVPPTLDDSYGSDVALVDLGDGTAVAAVSAPETVGGGEVFLFDVEFTGSLSVTPRGSVSGATGFGTSVALSAGHLIVGDPFVGGAGAVWVYERSGPGATFTGDPVRLEASNGEFADTLGVDVAIDGDVIVAGAPAAQKPNFPFRDGATYVFQNDGSDWVETDILRAADGFSEERFGDAVAVSGNRVLVGAPYDLNDLGPEAGAVYSFETTPPPSTLATFIDLTPSAPWDDPSNWSTGSVPAPGEPAIVPAGTSPVLGAATVASIGELTLGGSLFVEGRLELGTDSTVSATGLLSVGSGGVVELGATLTIDGGGQVITIEGPPPGVIEAGDGAGFAGSGLLGNSGTVRVTDGAVVAVGAGLSWPNGVNSLVDVADGTLDLLGAGFGPEGRIVIAPGSAIRAQNDVTFAASAVLEFGIDGPASSPANFGRLELTSGAYTANGTLRTQIFGDYEPTTDDVYTLVSCATGTCDGGTLDIVEVGDLIVDRTPSALTVRGVAAAVELTFDLDLAEGAPSSLAVAPAGIAVNTLDRSAVARAGGGASNVAASSITAIGPEDTSLASIQLGATPLRAVILESAELSAIPLVNIDIEGGWERIIALSANLQKEPLSSLTFGQVLREGDPVDGTTPAGVLAATPLRAVDVDGTPLRAVSLAAIALGSTPLRAVPLRAVAPGEPNPWCAYLGSALLAEYGDDCDAALDDLSLLEATLRGAPIDAAPLRAVPLRAVDIDATPLRAVLVEDIALGASPVGSIPLRAVPLRAVELQASPLRAVPLRAVGVDALPVSALDLEQAGPAGTPLRAVTLNASPLRAVSTSITLEAAPLRAVDADGVPVSAIRVQGAPLRAVPISAVMLADVPLRAVPLEEGGESFDWCVVLADIDAGFDCSNGVDLDTTTINDLSVRGVPLRAVPLRAVPLRAVLADATIGAIPLRAVPLRAVPLRAVPLGGVSLADTAVGSIDVDGTPLRAVPLRAVDLAGSPLGAIPLRAVEPGAVPLRAVPLRAVPLRAVPLRAVPLDRIAIDGTNLAQTPLRAVDVLGTPLRAVPLRAVDPALVQCTLVDCERGTLGDALRVGAISGDVTLAQIQAATEGLDLADLVAALLGVDTAAFLDALDLAGLTLEDLTSFDDLTLGDLPRGIVELDAVTLGELLAGLPVGTFADLVDALVDPATGQPIDGLEADLLAAIAGLDLVLGDLERLGDVTLDDIFAGTHPITLADIEPVLRFVTVDALQDALGFTVDIGTLTLGDLTAEELGQLTLADLSRLVSGEFDGEIDIADLLEALDVGDLLEGFTLGDLLLAFLDPGSLAYGGVEFAAVDVRALPADTVGSTTFEATFGITGSSARAIQLEIAVPRTAGYVSSSATISDGVGGATPLEPGRSGDALTWSFVAQPATSYSISFDVLPTLTLGSTSLAGVARVVGTDIAVPATASVAVVEGAEPNDFTTPAETTPAEEDVIYLTYVSPTDIDVFSIEVGQDDELFAELSNLDADLDLVLWGPKPDIGPDGALGPVSDDPPLFAVTDPDADTSAAEPLQDFPRLDTVDSTIGIVAVANADGTITEKLSTGRLAAGRYFVQVVGANGAANVQPAALQLKIREADTRPECVATDLPQFTGTTPVAPEESALANADTLVLINETRLEQVHDAAARTAVRDAADRLVAAALADPGLGITPVVVPVDAYLDVRNAYDAWDGAGSCDAQAANAVVAAINESIIDGERDHLEHVVILGPDELIPMARLSDRTRIANEYDYRHEFDGDLGGTPTNGRNAFTSTFWESSILSDEPYGDAAARSLGDRFLYVSDLALGRVVETPAEIVDALDTYLAFDGQLDIDTATVLGYDFLADGSQKIADTLAATLPVDQTLALGPDPTTPGREWTAAAATQKLREAATNALISLNAHFDHYRALPAIGDGVANFQENLIAQAVRNELGADYNAQSLVFSMGCHSGLSVSDVTIGRTNVDWPQTLGQQGALYVGNTGFGYGDTETVAYTEQLMALFAQQVTAPFETGDGSTTVGQALTWAKNEYVAGLQTFSVYDEKAVQESTFFGLPFYRIGLDTAELPEPPANAPAPDATGTPAIQVTLDPTNDEASTDRGTYFYNTDEKGNEQVIIAPGRPIQPQTVTDISVVDPSDTTSLGATARGAIVLDMQSTYRQVTDPVIATPVFDEEASQPEPTLTSGVFPTKQVEITTTTTAAGTRQQLVSATGQFRADDSIQRLDDDIDVVVYYADPSEPDVIPPTIGPVDATILDGVLTVSLTAGEMLGDDVDRVYVLVAQNPGPATAVVDWTGLDLSRTPGSNRWTGSLVLQPGTTDIEFVVQAKDIAGNVGYATNKARNFGEVVVPPAPPPPPPPPLELTVVAPPPPPSGWFTDSVVITIANAAAPATVFVNGVQRPGTLAAGETFTISDAGVQNWQVVTDTGRVQSGTVRIDTDGSPRVTLGVPGQDGVPVYLAGTARVDVICRDTSLVSCVLDIDGTPVDNGDPLPTTPGTYILSFSAADALGNVTSGSADFEIRAATAVPVITDSGIPTSPQAIADGVTISARFTDASPLDTFTATIDWGDGTSPENVTPTPPTSSAAGAIDANRVYAAPGVYEVTVTVTDAAGLSASETATVVVYDPAAAPIITGVTGPSSPQPLTTTITIAATFSDASAPNDSFTAIVRWGDGTTSTASVTPPTTPDGQGSITATRRYVKAGVYPVTVTVTDATGASTSDVFESVVVFDRTTKAQVDGAGIFWSGPEANAGTPWFGLPATFKFTAAYKKNATVPTGTTALNLPGRFSFTSTKYDYLIVNGSTATAEGIGTTGRNTHYRFRVQAIDNGWIDFVQITIWDPSTGSVLYDNSAASAKGDVVLLGGITVKGG